jgi:large subunit ribosomal protein L21
MYAVIKTGGKQYKVAVGEKLKIEQIGAEVGTVVALDQVFAVGSGETIALGDPLLAGATVRATVLAHGRHDKVRIFKMRRRKHYQKRQGHRQNFTHIQISHIGLEGAGGASEAGGLGQVSATAVTATAAAAIAAALPTAPAGSSEATAS